MLTGATGLMEAACAAQSTEWTKTDSANGTVLDLQSVCAVSPTGLRLVALAFCFCSPAFSQTSTKRCLLLNAPLSVLRQNICISQQKGGVYASHMQSQLVLT